MTAARIMDGKALAETLKTGMRDRVTSLKHRGITPRLVTVLVGDEPSSKVYVQLKERDCKDVGVSFETLGLGAGTSEGELFELIDGLNADNAVHGILVQLPLPPHLDKAMIVERIALGKDVDGLHPYNVGKLWTGTYDFDHDLLPCTPKGIVKLLDHYRVKLQGANAVIVNRSDLVGKPLSKLLLDRDATVTICHSKTTDLGELTERADILVTAVGRPDFVVTEGMIKSGSVVIDAAGDVDFDKVSEKASFITPCPGGVGPMTRAMLLQNVLNAAGRAK